MIDARRNDGCAEGVSDHQIDVIVSQLRRVCRQATMEYALNVGRIIIHNFYDGDISAWRGKGPKQASFRRLARRPDLPMSPVLLYRCVATYELCERIDALARWNNINVSHIRAVLNLPDDTQVELLSQANAERWSVRRLEELASAARSSCKTRRGQRNHLVRAVKALSRALAEHMSQRPSFDEMNIGDVRRTLSDAREVLEQLEEMLDPAAQVIDTRGACSDRPHDGAPSLSAHEGLRQPSPHDGAAEPSQS